MVQRGSAYLGACKQREVVGLWAFDMELLLLGPIAGYCFIVPLEASPYLLRFASERAASVATRAKFMAQLNGAQRVIGNELDDGEFLWQECFFPVFVPL